MNVKVQYIGLRTDQRKVFQAFRWGKKEIYFTGIKFLIIGEWYKASRKDGRTTIERIPETVDGPELKEDERYEFEAKEIMARDFRAKCLAANKAKNNKGLIKLLAPLKPYLKGLSYTEKRALFEFLIDYFE